MSKNTNDIAAGKVIVQIGWNRFLIRSSDVQKLIDVFANAFELERDYPSEGPSYNYIAGAANLTISTISDEIEAGKRPAVEAPAEVETA